MFDPEKIRQDFPALQQRFNGKPPIYFDNACVTLRPKQVVEAMNEYYEKFPACAGRSSHSFAQQTTRRYEEARQTIARFINVSPDEIIFTRNTTEGINLVAHSFEQPTTLNPPPSTHHPQPTVLTSDKEHNSNLVPWIRLAKNGKIRHTVLPSRPDQTFDLENFKNEIKQHKDLTPNLLTPNLLSLVYASNLDGVTNPVEEIVKIAHENNFLVLLDAAQAVPHQKIDVKKLDADFLAFSGHKMLGPSGIGVLYGKHELLEKLPPFIVGGETVSDATYREAKFVGPPHKFEGGLQNYAGALGLAAAVEYLNKIGLEKIEKHLVGLNKFLTAELLQIDGLQILGPKEAALRGGILTFRIEGADSHKIALLLDASAKIMVRSGVFCLHAWFNARNIKGAARASLYLYNTLEECQTFVQTLKKIIKTVT